MFSIGIDLGGTNTVAGLVDESGRLLRKRSINTARHATWQEIVGSMIELTNGLIRETGVEAHDIIAAGIGSPGLVDSHTGTILFASNLNFRSSPVAQLFESKTGIKTYLANDADAAAYGEFIAGCGRSYQDFITVTLGTGVGGGIIIGGKIMSGHYPGGGELGHIVIQAGGYTCNCGRRGCWEEYSSASALIREANKAAMADQSSILNNLIIENQNIMDARLPFIAARQGDPAAARLIQRYIEYLAIGLGNVVQIFRPEAIALGGGISKEGEKLLAPLRAQLCLELGCTNNDLETNLIVCELGNDAGVIGAAMLYKNAIM